MKMHDGGFALPYMMQDISFDPFVLSPSKDERIKYEIPELIFLPHSKGKELR